MVIAEQDTTHTSLEVTEDSCGNGSTQWIHLFASSSLDEIVEKLHGVKAFCFDELDHHPKITDELSDAINSLIDVIIDDKPIGNKRMRELCGTLFVHYDLYIVFLKQFIPKINTLETNTQKWNVFRCLRSLPLPTKKFPKAFFTVEANKLKRGKGNTKLKRWYQDAWLSFIKHELPKSLLKSLIPYVDESVLSALRDPSLMADFLFRVFKLGDIFAVISLSAIFKLMMEHNFEFENFFESVYELTTPSICYLSYRQRFFSLLDTFLSSTHLSCYIVAAFVKRLCRLALFAPLCCQLPLIGLIRNLLTRHEGVRILLHRENPATLESDPYDMNEKNLKECGALDSSLWEIKTLQRYWYGDVSRRARFVDKGIQKMESFVRWKTDEEYFDVMMSSRFGSDLAKHADEEKYRREQTKDSDEEYSDVESNANEEPKKKRARRYQTNKQAMKQYELPINTNEPDSSQFFSSTLLFDFKEFCHY